MHGGFHHGALVAWLLAALLPAAITGNPLYLGADLALVALLYSRLGRGSASKQAAAWGGFARLGVLFALFTVGINLLFGGVGETVLFTLPSWNPNDGPFQVGGAVTAESLVFGLVSALALLVALLALAVFNGLVDHYQLLRAVPAFLYQSATVVSIALVFLPQLARAQREIREAQALRGHRVRGLRDLAPLVLTLLGEALERAVRLAESMEARGYAAPAHRGESAERESRGARLAIVGGLGSILAGAVLRDAPSESRGRLDLVDLETLGTGLALLGVVALVATLGWLGRRARRTRHRHARWRGRDTLLTALSLLCAVTLVALRARRPELFAFQILPVVERPSFVPWLLLPVLAAPALLFAQLAQLARSSGPSGSR